MGVADLYSNNWNFYITLIPILLELSATLAYGGLRRGWDSNIAFATKMALFYPLFGSNSTESVFSDIVVLKWQVSCVHSYIKLMHPYIKNQVRIHA